MALSVQDFVGKDPEDSHFFSIKTGYSVFQKRPFLINNIDSKTFIAAI